MVAEVRASRLDLYARTKFVKEGREITESRAQVEDMFDEPHELAGRTTVSSLTAAAGIGLVEWG